MLSKINSIVIKVKSYTLKYGNKCSEPVTKLLNWNSPCFILAFGPEQSLISGLLGDTQKLEVLNEQGYFLNASRIIATKMLFFK